MGEYVRAAYLAVGLLLPLLVLLRMVHPYPSTQDLALSFLLGMGGTLLVLLIRGIGTWPSGGLSGAFLTAGALEEGVKLTLGLLFLRRLEVEVRIGPAEAAIVLAFLGAGFEAVEDFQYLIGGLSQGIPWGEVVAARALPMHLALGLACGGYLARALAGRPWWFLVSWALACALHGGFNSVAGSAGFPLTAGYAGGVVLWGLSSFFFWHRRSPWALRRRLARMDPWEAAQEVRSLGWEGVELLLSEKARSSAAWWVLALGLGILYPLLVLGLGLLMEAMV